MTNVARDLLRCHRLEHPFLPHYLCYAGWGACFAAADVNRPPDGLVGLVVVANLLAIVGGNPVNSVADVRTDAATTAKRDVARAVLRVGRRRLLVLAAGEMALALAGAVVAAVALGRPLVAAGVAMIIAIHLAYNVEPVRLKRRGFAGPVALGVQVGLLPLLTSYHAASSEVDGPVWMIAVALTALAAGRALWWLVPDRCADAATGTMTPAVRHGPGRTLAAAGITTAVALTLLGWGLWWRFGLGWALLGVAVSAFFLAGEMSAARDDLAGQPALALRLRGMPRVVFANLVLAFIPLVAG